jgi:hypothetical protein
MSNYLELSIVLKITLYNLLAEILQSSEKKPEIFGILRTFKEAPVSTPKKYLKRHCNY